MANTVDLLVVIPTTTSSFTAECSSQCACVEMTCYRRFHLLLPVSFYNLCKLTNQCPVAICSVVAKVVLFKNVCSVLLRSCHLPHPGIRVNLAIGWLGNIA